MSIQEISDLEEDEYLVLITYWKHAKYSDFSRITTFVSQKDGQEVDLAIVQYQFEGEEHHISPKKNPQKKKPFILSGSSTRQSIEAKLKHPMGPSTIYLTIILRNRAEYRLILSRQGRRPSRLKSDDIPQD